MLLPGNDGRPRPGLGLLERVELVLLLDLKWVFELEAGHVGTRMLRQGLLARIQDGQRLLVARTVSVRNPRQAGAEFRR